MEKFNNNSKKESGHSDPETECLESLRRLYLKQIELDKKLNKLTMMENIPHGNRKRTIK